MEQVKAVFAADGETQLLIADVQRQVKAALSKFLIFFHAGFEQLRNGSIRFNHAAGSRFIYMDNDAVFHAKSRLIQMSDHLHGISDMLHGVPPYGGSLYKIRENLRLFLRQ